jgi:hypothetical protein
VKEGEDFEERSAEWEEERAVAEVDRETDRGQYVEHSKGINEGDKAFLGEAYQEQVEKWLTVFLGPE